MEILEIVKTLQAYTEDVVAYKLDSEFAHAVTEAVSLLIEQGERLTDVEVVHGQWEKDTGSWLCGRCSVCKREFLWDNIETYCPACGSRNRGVE